MPHPPPSIPTVWKWLFACFIPVCEGGNFCLARFSAVPDRWDESKSTQEEVEQKLMSVSAVQCVFSWLADPMNKSKFLFLSVFPPPLFSRHFLSLPLSCSIALLCTIRTLGRSSYLLAGLVSHISWQAYCFFRHAWTIFLCCVVLWPEKQDYAFQGWVSFRFLFFSQAGLPS